MLRSPFFCFIIFLFLFSCKEKTTVTVNIKPIYKEALKLRNKGISDFEKKNYNVAFYNFNKAKIKFETIQDSLNIAYNLIQMAAIQQINGDYYGSKETLTEALPYVEKNKLYNATINNNFGIADKELALYDDAIFYYKKAMIDYTDPVLKQTPLSNIAALYIYQKKYDKTIAILESILSKNKLSDEEKARIQDNLGYAYFKKGFIKKGFNLMIESLDKRNQMDDTYGSIESNLHLADYYTTIYSKKSDQYALDAYNNATKHNSIDERLEALQFLISNDYNAQNVKYVKKYMALNDSIIKIRNNFKNKFAKIRYDSKKEKDENQKLRLEKAENLLSLQQAKYMRIVFVIVFVFLLILIMVLIRFYRNRNRIIKIKTSYDTETRIAKKIHDELANDVFNAIAFAETQPLSKENTRENLLQKLDDIYVRVRGISKENNNIDTGEKFIKNIKEMLSTYNSNSRNIIVNNVEQINWETIDDIKKITISRILQELMVNMKKHSEAKLVLIQFDNDTKSILINYTDNGKGSEQTEMIKNGLQNMESRIEAVKGTIAFETAPEKGFKVKISIPK